MIQEFRKFALRGNVVDMGVGIIIGAAFGRIVSSFVTDVLTPPLGLVLGSVNFTNLFLNLDADAPEFATLAEAKAAGVPTLNYGLFLNAIIDFTIVAIALFFLIRWINKLKGPPPAPAPAAPMKDCPECLSKVPEAARRCAHCTSALA